MGKGGGGGAGRPTKTERLQTRSHTAVLQLSKYPTFFSLPLTPRPCPMNHTLQLLSNTQEQGGGSYWPNVQTQRTPVTQVTVQMLLSVDDVVLHVELHDQR